METREEKIYKENLRKSADSYKNQLEEEVNESLSQLDIIVKTAVILVCGGILGYTVYKVFFQDQDTSPKNKRNEKDGKDTKETLASKGRKSEPQQSDKSKILQPLIKAGAEVAASYLLVLARQKLIEYIRDLNITYKSSNGHSKGNH